MAKASKTYRCQSCGAQFSKWVGKCLECGNFGSLLEAASDAHQVHASDFKATKLRDLVIPSEEEQRQKTGLGYLDRLLGGGLPSGSVVLLAGEPGIGKSTLLFQMLSQSSVQSLYVSSEESLSQIGRRFKKFQKDLGDRMFLLAEQNVSDILNQMELIRPRVMVLDSIQMLHAGAEKGFGQSTNMREVTDALVSRAKQLDISLFIVGHVTKDGEIAGPKTLEHQVDVVLVFGMAEDSRLRILQAQKNRFGPSGEVVLLEMGDGGLVESQEADSYWVRKHQKQIYGCAVAGVLLGSRILPVEIQALVVNSYFPSPRRSTSGFEYNRLLLILAVLEKRMKIPFSRYDVFLNVVGGIKIADPGADLAVAMALISAVQEHPLDPDTVYVGELGLTGEIRPAPLQKDRISSLLRRRGGSVVSAEIPGVAAPPKVLYRSSIEELNQAKTSN